MSTTRPSVPRSPPGPDGTFFVEARAPLDEVSTAVGFDFAAHADAEDVDTIGGLITAVAGRVPVRGEIISGSGGFEFEVLDADARRVKRLKIHRRVENTGSKATRPSAGDEKSSAEPEAPAAGRT